MEVEYLRGPPDPDGDARDTFTPPAVPPEADWRILVETYLFPGRSGGLFLHSLGPDGALTRITGRKGLTRGADASPDGRWLAYSHRHGEENRPGFGLFFLTPGETSTRVAADDSDSIMPAFSPDGRSVAYASGSPEDRDLFLYTMNSGANRVLVDDVGRVSHPSWSPTGGQLAFARTATETWTCTSSSWPRAASVASRTWMAR